MDVDALAGLVVDLLQANLKPVQAELSAVKGQLAGWEARWDDLSALRERIAVVEVKALQPPQTTLQPTVIDAQPGPPGRDGRDGLPGVPGQPGDKGLDGKDGTNGIDGKDGLGFGDLVVEQLDERSFVLKAVSGDRVQTCGTVTFPVQINRGVYQGGHAYAKGDLVTWGGSQWYCKEDTVTKPGEVIGAASWVLVVKKGRDGRDGRDGKDASLPVVKVGG